MYNRYFSEFILTRQSLLLVIMFVLSSCKLTQPKVSQNTSPTIYKSLEEDWQSALKTSFRQHYGVAVDEHAEKMHAEYPVIIQDLLNMTLVRSNGERVRFKMDNEVYLTLAHTSHPPMTIYSILSTSDFKLDDNNVLLKFDAYNALLERSIEGMSKTNHLEEGQKSNVLRLLKVSNEYVETVLANKQTTKDEYHEFAKSIRPLVKKNLYDGAMEQLTQFLERMEGWKTEFPKENWDELRVAVMGFHQPRNLYAQKLFFQWLLDEPKIEKRVVYAEFQFSIFGQNNQKAESLALELLTKVDLEKEPSYFLLGEETLLQKDVLGPATEQILQGWGESQWFLNDD